MVKHVYSSVTGGTSYRGVDLRPASWHMLRPGHIGRVMLNHIVQEVRTLTIILHIFLYKYVYM